MASEPGLLQFAVLIDGENISPKVADQLFREVAKLGQAPVRRVYGDFDGPAKGWKDAVSRHAIVARQQFRNVPNKNASDIALVIEAMDLMHTRQLDGFCLVASDSDYTGLATRLREQGLQVFGFGGKVAALSFRQACHQFIEVEIGKPATEGPIFVSPRKPVAIVLNPAKPASAKNLLMDAFARLNADDWVPLSVLLKEVRAIQPQFTPKDYGAAKPIALVRKTGCFDAELRGGTMMVRKKPAAAAMAAKAA